MNVNDLTLVPYYQNHKLQSNRCSHVVIHPAMKLKSDQPFNLVLKIDIKVSLLARAIL